MWKPIVPTDMLCCSRRYSKESDSTQVLGCDVGTCGRNCMWLKLLLRGIKYTVRGIWELRLAEGAGSCSIPCCLLGLYPLRGMATKIPVPFQSEGGGYKPSAAGLPEFKSWPYHFLASCLQTGYLIFLLVHLWNRNCAYLVGC